MKTTSVIRLLVLVAVAMVLARCGKEGSKPASGTFGSVYASISTSNCVQCHKPNGSAQTDASVTLDFTSQATAYAGLSTKSSTSTQTPLCSTAKLVTAGDDTKSYFLGILFSNYAINNFAGIAGCQPNYNQHHLNENLTADEKTSFVNWVKNGAKND